MKVLYFHQHFTTPKGASGIRSYQMAQHLIRRGHQVEMVCGSYRGGDTGLSGPFRWGMRRGTVDGISVIEFRLPYSNHDGLIRRTITFFRFALMSVWWAIRADCDLIFATSTPLTAGIPGIVARWVRRRRFVFEVRDLWPELPKEMGTIRNPFILGCMSLLELASYRSAHRCIGLAPGIVDGIARRGVHRENIAMIPNGCDLTLFDPSVVSVTRPAGIKETDCMAIFTGTHGPANGLDAVLDTAAELKRRNADTIKLVFVGDGKQKPQLLQRAQDQKLTNVYFLDPVGKSQVAELLATADIGLQILRNVPAFYYGTSPNKFFDYLAAGKPVLINYPGWAAELVAEHKCGVAVPPEDPGEMADALQMLATDIEGRSRMGIAARGLAEAQFSRIDLANQWVNWLETVDSLSS